MKIRASPAMVILAAVITVALGKLGGPTNVEAFKDCERLASASGPRGDPHTETNCTGWAVAGMSSTSR
jgi:hypothetical protein